MSLAQQKAGMTGQTPNAQPKEPGAAARILIVDDQRFDRMRLKRLCGSLDFPTRLAEADSLAAMMQQIDGARFDLILLDYSLPDGNGLRALELIAAHPNGAGAATVMITGTDQTEVAIEALQGGCSDYIDKDELSPHTLRRSAINALQKSALQIGMEAKEQKRSQLAQVLAQFSDECAEEIRPIVTRMLEGTRRLRAGGHEDPRRLAEGLEDIERACLRLQEFVADLGSYGGQDLAQETMAEEAQAAPPGLGTRGKALSKPPSPFRSRR